MKKILKLKLPIIVIGALMLSLIWHACKKENQINDEVMDKTDMALRVNTSQNNSSGGHGGGPGGGLGGNLNKDMQFSNLDTDCLPMMARHSNFSQVEEDEYDNTLRMIAEGLVKLTGDNNFVNLVKTEAGKQFDGDYNVLLRDINTKGADKGFNLALEMRNSIMQHGSPKIKPELEKINGRINSFNYYNEKLYAQIYIPFYEEVDHTARPIIAINYNDNEILDGLELVDNNDGTQLVNKIFVDEIKAKKQTVWVVSVNERVDCAGNVADNIVTGKAAGCPDCSNGIQDCNETGIDCGGTDCAPCPGTSAVEFRDKILNMNGVYISDKKEAWGNGRADISWMGMHYINCKQYPILQMLSFIKVSDKKLNSWISVNEWIADDLSVTTPWEENETIAILLFEKDVRAKFEKTWTVKSGCPVLYYYSKESAYGSIYYDHADYPSQNNWVTVEHILSGAKVKIRNKFAN